MMVFAFSYMQVMPAFLDFVFPFGRQEFPDDFQYAGFRHESSVGEGFEALCVPELGRSGMEIRMCYSLKSVEPSAGQKEWPWSIRMTSVYHAFDVKFGHATWLMVKGNDLMKSRISETTGSQKLFPQSSYDSVKQAFASTLGIHWLLGEWSAENWRWYLNFLDNQLQGLTRQTLAMVVDGTPITTELGAKDYPQVHTRQSTTSTLVEKGSLPDSETKTSFYKSFSAAYHALKIVTKSPPDLPTVPCTLSRQDGHPEFSLIDLQKLQDLQEKVNEATLTIKSNISVITELGEYYVSIVKWEDWPEEILRQSERYVIGLSKRFQIIEKDLHVQLSRTESLSNRLADRKALLYAVLEYRTLEANRVLAEKARRSADNMEDMTRGMHDIAQKTQQETVSMRIITLVTLFFLPGTFISVHAT